jgi:amino acid adenylation domain-containing protein
VDRIRVQLGFYREINRINDMSLSLKNRKQAGTDKTLVEAFESQVNRSPDAIALRYETQVLTYRELNERVNQLAHFLVSSGTLQEDPVAICMHRSLEMVIALYAVLKAGGAYLPLEPDFPDQRLEYMTRNAGAKIVLTHRLFREKFDTNPLQVICIDAQNQALAEQSKENLNLVIEPDQLAYIIYTSGSTGNPKGVMNEHRGIMNRLIWMQKELQLTCQDRVLQKTPYSFDVSVWEFFWPLQVGAQLILAKPLGHKDNAYLSQLIQADQITTLHFVPSMLKFFLEEKSARQCKSIQRVVCSGEALRTDHKSRFYEVLNARLYNMYGPTEAAVDVTSYYCDPLVQEDFIPIGRPIDHVDIYLLNNALEQLPDGEVGEIHIGGIQVARGYINQPELTAEKFIPDPFADHASDRLYKTGDLGRRLPDGNIEYLGRTDFQVKIRGIRVELSEIETQINQQDGIQDCVVAMWEDPSGGEHLVAYYCEYPSRPVHVGPLKEELKTRLPDFMIPQHFMRLDEMPLLPNGKVSRKALPAPAFKRDTSTEYIEPTTTDEACVTEIWKRVLELDEVGTDDSFFDIGGNSFLLMSILSELNQQYTQEISLMDLFTYTTVSNIVRFLNETNNQRR